MRRVGTRTPPLRYLVRALTLLLAAALIWYGLMAVLLAAKVSPHTVNDLSGYRSLFDDVRSLRASDFSTAVRLIAGFAGLLVFIVFFFLALQEIPRPRVVRHRDIELARDERGTVLVRPRVLERLAEVGARGRDGISRAGGRLRSDDLHVDVGVRDSHIAAEALADVRERVAGELARHDLPALDVSVTLTSYDPTSRRELA